MKKKLKEENCIGCEYHSKCAGIIFSHMGAPIPPIVSGSEKKEWCHNWIEFDKQKRKEKEVKDDKSKI